MKVSELKKIFDYDPNTGIIRSKVKNGRWQAGRAVGSMAVNGYLRLRVLGKDEYSHRLAWALYYGDWPDRSIDHLNRNRSDNSIENLRLADHNQNAANQSLRSDNTSGKKGVTWNARRGKWEAQIQFKGVRKSGYFDSIEDASAFYDMAAESFCKDYFTKSDSAIKSYKN